jgi:hypothetical protein
MGDMRVTSMSAAADDAVALRALFREYFAWLGP